MGACRSFFCAGVADCAWIPLAAKLSRLKKHASWFALAFCIPYGGLLEIMQGTLFEERSMDVYDFIADSFGALLAVLFYKTLSSKIKFLHQPQ